METLKLISLGYLTLSSEQWVTPVAFYSIFSVIQAHAIAGQPTTSQ